MSAIVVTTGMTIAPGSAPTTTAEAIASMPALDHVFVIVMENHSYSEIIGSTAAPYVNGLVAGGGLATSYYAVSHPSLPNYLALTSGSTLGVTSDCTTCWQSAANVGDVLENAGVSWKAYMESMPSPCYAGDSYPYAQKHDPFVYFNDIRNNASRCQSHVVPYGQLSTDLRSASTTPRFGWITPNMCDDMHDCAVSTGDSWLSAQVPAILSSPAFTKQRSLLAITWDEDDSAASDRVPLLLLGSAAVAGFKSSTAYNHYGLLHTIEAGLGASTLTSNDLGAATLNEFLTTTSSAAAPVNRTSALPQDELHFGLASEPTDIGWMTGSGVPWRYRYAYLSAGVNTGAGWETWNSPSGQYATNYMNASDAGGYIPVFSYYELLQSTPSSGTNESDRDFSNLNNATTMAAYYANFKLLMQKAGAFGKTVVIQVEPDLWGYLEQRAAGGTASNLSASVASSGFAEASGLPNTAAGFAYELLELRDTYAANALLAIHASPWGSGIDIASDTRSSVSAVTEADTTAAFLNSAGVASDPYGSTWDLVFNDVDDHDAGWWEAQGANNSSFTHWWDPSNANFPNFTRYLAWVSELHAKTSRPQIVWQVPEGNQYYLTMNNTCGHYQDHLAQYFISHASDLHASGLIAVLFGAGNSCQSNNTDARSDGVTNGGGVPTADLAGYCSACNTHTSTVSDDDGGFLQTFVGQYYAGTSCATTIGLPATESTVQFSVPLSATGCSTAPLELQQYDSTLGQGWFSVNTAAQGYPGHTYEFRARGRTPSGSLGAWGTATTQVSSTATTTLPFHGMYTLDAYGGVNMNSSPPLAGSAYWPGWKIAHTAHFQPGASAPQSGLVLDGYGGLHSYGAPITPHMSAYWHGWDIARDFAFLPDGTGGYVMDGYGGLHGFAVGDNPMPPAVHGAAYWQGFDIARKVVIFSDGTGGLVLDGYGGLHPFAIGSNAVPAKPSGGAYWPGFKIARDIALIPGTHAGYLLDGYGGLHPFGGAPAVSSPPPYWGWDIARAIFVLPGSTMSAASGYVLDGYGGAHPFGGAPAVSSPYWPGKDIGRTIWGA
jgi:hypothetical protein